jgi:hypothetical protein
MASAELRGIDATTSSESRMLIQNLPSIRARPMAAFDYPSVRCAWASAMPFDTNSTSAQLSTPIPVKPVALYTGMRSPVASRTKWTLSDTTAPAY